MELPREWEGMRGDMKTKSEVAPKLEVRKISKYSQGKWEGETNKDKGKLREGGVSEMK